MMRLTISLVMALCAASGIGCKVIQTRSTAAKKLVTPSVSEEQDPASELSLGQASFEQYATSPGTSPARSPYYFGGGGNAPSGAGSVPARGGSKTC